MFGSIGGFELLLLAVIGLLVFGPRRLPEIGRTLGKAMVEFRRAAMELRTSIEREVNLEDVREATRSIQKTGRDLLKGTLPKLEEVAPRLDEVIPDLEEKSKPLDKLGKDEEGPGTADVVKPG